MTSVVDPGFLEQAGEPVGDWHPARYTPTLSGTEEFTTQGDKLLAFADRHWTTPETWPLKVVLDVWQRWLIRHVLETYPDDWPVAHLRGQLRYRQVLISVGRQNGKSLLAALFAIYFLCLHVKGPRIIGLASRTEQARIVYDRVKFAIDKSEALSRDLKTTATRGITRRDGTGLYQTLPAKEESAQGEPASGAIYDELHIGLKALWTALVLAQRARRNALLIGITTAGDDASELLITLYKDAEAALEGADERFGVFIWEAPSDELTEEGLIAANPGVACGRIPLDLAMDEARKTWRDQTRDKKDGLTGRQRVIRYTLNRFITGAGDSWASTEAWNGSAIDGAVEHDGDVVYSIERTDSWEYASITATSKVGNEYRTELVATFTEPTHDLLLEACVILARRGRCVFAMDSKTLSRLHKALQDKGFEAWKLGDAEMVAAAQNAHGLIARRAILHPGDPLVRIQMARARRRTLPEGWRISRSLSTGEIDTVIGLVVGTYVATVRGDQGIQLG